jgi:hypothetical protein
LVYDQSVRRLGICAAIAMPIMPFVFPSSAVFLFSSKPFTSSQMPGSPALGNAFAKDGTKPEVLIMSACAWAASANSARAAGAARARPPAMATRNFGDFLVAFMSGLLFRGSTPGRDSTRHSVPRT